jgi:KDO2-lipid IV(A) lauroyltransferase
LAQWVFDRLRRAEKNRYISKGRSGAREALQVIKKGGFLGLLIDQRMNDGVAVNFMGHKAMTADAPAKLAMRAACPIIPVRVERTAGARFRVTCCAPIECAERSGKDANRQIMEELNAVLAEWIHQKPQDWLWLHRRWG